MAIMRVRFKIGGSTGLPGLHTTYWNGTGTSPVAADALDVVDRVHDFWEAISELLSAGLDITCTDPVDVLESTTGELTGSLPPGTVAPVEGDGSSTLPRATMLLLKYLTDDIVGGRRLRGRSFIGPLSVTTNTTGSVTPGSNTTLLTAAGNLQTGTTGSRQVVWHRPTQALPASGVVSEVTSYASSSEFSVLRSRRD